VGEQRSEGLLKPPEAHPLDAAIGLVNALALSLPFWAVVIWRWMS
jgi:hypothetical protein